ncbi:unnamed protein product [Amoebophrya sp. A120]|nr:unnamed protein product [Amoebophrya sp. A120]|eukprot:GSA120T00017205001.1
MKLNYDVEGEELHGQVHYGGQGRTNMHYLYGRNFNENRESFCQMDEDVDRQQDELVLLCFADVRDRDRVHDDWTRNEDDLPGAINLEFTAKSSFIASSCSSLMGVHQRGGYSDVDVCSAGVHAPVKLAFVQPPGEVQHSLRHASAHLTYRNATKPGSFQRTEVVSCKPIENLKHEEEALPLKLSFGDFHVNRFSHKVFAIGKLQFQHEGTSTHGPAGGLVSKSLSTSCTPPVVSHHRSSFIHNANVETSSGDHDVTGRNSRRTSGCYSFFNSNSTNSNPNSHHSNSGMFIHGGSGGAPGGAPSSRHSSFYTSASQSNFGGGAAPHSTVLYTVALCPVEEMSTTRTTPCTNKNIGGRINHHDLPSSSRDDTSARRLSSNLNFYSSTSSLSNSNLVHHDRAAQHAVDQRSPSFVRSTAQHADQRSSSFVRSSHHLSAAAATPRRSTTTSGLPPRISIGRGRATTTSGVTVSSAGAAAPAGAAQTGTSSTTQRASTSQVGVGEAQLHSSAVGGKIGMMNVNVAEQEQTSATPAPVPKFNFDNLLLEHMSSSSGTETKPGAAGGDSKVVNKGGRAPAKKPSRSVELEHAPTLLETTPASATTPSTSVSNTTAKGRGRSSVVSLAGGSAKGKDTSRKEKHPPATTQLPRGSKGNIMSSLTTIPDSSSAGAARVNEMAGYSSRVADHDESVAAHSRSSRGLSSATLDQQHHKGSGKQARVSSSKGGFIGSSGGNKNPALLHQHSQRASLSSNKGGGGNMNINPAVASTVGSSFMQQQKSSAFDPRFPADGVISLHKKRTPVARISMPTASTSTTAHDAPAAVQQQQPGAAAGTVPHQLSCPASLQQPASTRLLMVEVGATSSSTTSSRTEDNNTTNAPLVPKTPTPKRSLQTVSSNTPSSTRCPHDTPSMTFSSATRGALSSVPPSQRNTIREEEEQMQLQLQHGFHDREAAVDLHDYHLHNHAEEVDEFGHDHGVDREEEEDNPLLLLDQINADKNEIDQQLHPDDVAIYGRESVSAYDDDVNNVVVGQDQQEHETDRQDQRRQSRETMTNLIPLPPFGPVSEATILIPSCNNSAQQQLHDLGQELLHRYSNRLSCSSQNAVSLPGADHLFPGAAPNVVSQDNAISRGSTGDSASGNFFTSSSSNIPFNSANVENGSRINDIIPSGVTLLDVMNALNSVNNGGNSANNNLASLHSSGNVSNFSHSNTNSLQNVDGTTANDNSSCAYNPDRESISASVSGTTSASIFGQQMLMINQQQIHSSHSSAHHLHLPLAPFNSLASCNATSTFNGAASNANTAGKEEDQEMHQASSSTTTREKSFFDNVRRSEDSQQHSVQIKFPSSRDRTSGTASSGPVISLIPIGGGGPEERDRGSSGANNSGRDIPAMMNSVLDQKQNPHGFQEELQLLPPCYARTTMGAAAATNPPNPNFIMPPHQPFMPATGGILAGAMNQARLSGRALGGSDVFKNVRVSSCSNSSVMNYTGDAGAGLGLNIPAADIEPLVSGARQVSSSSFVSSTTSGGADGGTSSTALAPQAQQILDPAVRASVTDPLLLNTMTILPPGALGLSPGVGSRGAVHETAPPGRAGRSDGAVQINRSMNNLGGGGANTSGTATTCSSTSRTHGREHDENNKSLQYSPSFDTPTEMTVISGGSTAELGCRKISGDARASTVRKHNFRIEDAEATVSPNVATGTTPSTVLGEKVALEDKTASATANSTASQKQADHLKVSEEENESDEVEICQHRSSKWGMVVMVPSSRRSSHIHRPSYAKGSLLQHQRSKSMN